MSGTTTSGDLQSALSGQMARWHLPLEELDPIVVLQYEEAFDRMLGAGPPPRTAGSGSSSDTPPPPFGLRFASMPSMLAVMNLAVTVEDLAPIAEKFALLPDDGSDDDEPAGDSSAAPLGAAKDGFLDEQDAIGGKKNESAANRAPVSVYDLLFDWPGTAALYEHLLPAQNGKIADYISLFSFLDGDEKAVIRVSDLRHALCRMGTAPLSENEFSHMLYRHKMLHRDSVTIFEFMRVLLCVPIEPMAAALLRISREDWADSPSGSGRPV